MGRVTAGPMFFARGLAIAIAASVAACRPIPSDATLAALKGSGESLLAEGKIEDAQDAFKEYLRQRPLDEDAHYLLGRTYILALDARPILAEGEYQTALRLFEKRLARGEPTVYSEQRFRLMCALESAKAMYVRAGTLDSYKIPREYVMDALLRSDAHLKAAEAIDPDDADVRHVRQRLNALAHRLRIPLNPSQPPSAQFA